MKSLLLLLLFFISVLLSDEKLKFEDDFLNSLEEVSEIATKTKLNIDDTPSFITILHSDKLKKLGVDNVFEAVALVPGVQVTKEISGVPVVIFRGVSQKGEVKLMVDGVTINNSYRGSIYYYLDFPIEMIDRIEVIRGAGSVLYGSGAMSGVINIITNTSQNNNKNSVFVSGGTHNSQKYGALLSTTIKDIKFKLDGYAQKNNKTVFVNNNLSGKIGDSDRRLKDYSTGASIEGENLSFMGRIKKSNVGNAYGILQVLDDTQNHINNVNTSIYTQLSYKGSINNENKIMALAGYNEYKQRLQDRHSPKTMIKTDYRENSYYGEINLISKSIENNELLLGMKAEFSKTLHSKWDINLVPTSPLSDPDLDRETYSYYLNNIYSMNSDFDISTGIRYDYYSDIGESFSPTVGLVYRLNQKIKLKALYSHAFRAPSWVELSSNSTLDAEESDTGEVGFIFQANKKNTLRWNFYVTKINDMIEKSLITRKYVQNSENNFYGSELEYIYTPNNQTELNLFATYIEAKDKDNNDLANIANVLVTGSFTYELNSGITFGSLLKYVSKSDRSEFDTRSKMDDSLIYDQTISYTYKDFTASLIVKDLFDAGTYYALPANKYGTDFDDDGRVILIKASMEF